ncbi:hypothetical protein BaRGS_00017526 [Batillaria attramentaria]|uniref:Uncharacterized protein n=1 Tax=Batillaria attramentaria TaxID=370345 RepID=A0ABD0KVQ6_9CAEN
MPENIRAPGPPAGRNGGSLWPMGTGSTCIGRHNVALVVGSEGVATKHGARFYPRRQRNDIFSTSTTAAANHSRDIGSAHRTINSITCTFSRCTKNVPWRLTSPRAGRVSKLSVPSSR